jgi:hypothetical protein
MKSLLTLTFALLLTGAGAALAQTPDELPPSSETVCDAEIGSAYGHCNAYCEAMDCELANDGDPTTEPSASANACSKVRSKFQQTTGRDLPCEAPRFDCPCLDVPDTLFTQILAGEITISACSIGSPFGPGDGVFVSSPEIPSSRYVYSAVNGNNWYCGGPSGSGKDITTEQGQDCAQLLEQEANRQGVTCVPAV